MQNKDSEKGTFSFLDDDNFSEVYLDIEKGSNEENNSHVTKNIESESNVSMGDLYEQEKTNQHFFDKLSLELENIKEKHNKRSDENVDGSSIIRNAEIVSENENNRNSWKRKQQYYEDKYFSNSPLTMSLCSSNAHSDYEDSVDQSLNSKRGFKKLTYQEVEDSLNKYYTKEIQISSEIDILLTYLKGQKHLFKQASRVTEQKFNLLMFPAIFITGSMTVVTPFMTHIGWSGWIMSILNAILTVMITINNFMKWQAVAAIYLTISNQYDKLGISVEMTRNQYIFIDEGEERNRLTLEKMRDTEKRIMDIQNNYNDIIIPYEVQLLNPIISHINIFSFIKKIEHHKKSLIMKYKDVKNEIRFVMYRWDKEQTHDKDNSPILNTKKKEELDRLQELINKKESVKNQLIQNNSNNVYTYIDNLFIREINNSENYYTYRSTGMYLLFTPKTLSQPCGNEVVDDYLKFIFTKDAK